MPTITVNRPNVSVDEAATVIKAQLGGKIETEAQEEGKLRVIQGTLSIAHVKAVSQGNTTVFHVHGGGLIFGRIINEVTFSRKVAGALKAGLAGRVPS